MSDKLIGRIHKINVKNRKPKSSAESKYDSLTGLYTKKYFRSCIDKYISEHGDSNSALIVVDVDNFKTVNDNLGTAFGDEVLRSIAKALSSCLASEDLIGRIGGDEFIIFIKKYIDKEQIIKVIRAFPIDPIGLKFCKFCIYRRIIIPCRTVFIDKSLRPNGQICLAYPCQIQQYFYGIRF